MVANEEYQEKNSNDVIEEDIIGIENEENSDEEDNSSSEEDSVAPENRKDESMTEKEVTKSNHVCITRSGRVSKPHTHATKFSETAQHPHGNISMEKGTLTKPH